MLIHYNAKARVHNMGHLRINRVAGRDSAYNVLDDDKLQFCHIQGYEPRVYQLKQGRDHGPSSHGMDRHGVPTDDRALSPGRTV